MTDTIYGLRHPYALLLLVNTVTMPLLGAIMRFLEFTCVCLQNN